MKHEIVTMGSATVDVFLETDAHEHAKEICYPVGGKFIIKNLDISTGGGGTNTAVAFSKLGFKTGYVGKIGEDQNGDLVLQDLKKNKVEFLGARGKEKTGYSVILDSKENDRTILTFKGASNFLKLSEVKKEIFDAKFFYFSSMMEDSFKVQEKFAEIGAKKGIRIAYNPSSYQAKKGIPYLKNLLQKIEILVLNKEEAEILVGKKDALQKLRSHGPKIVCVTDGERGSEVYDGISLYKVGARKVKVAETTGAGDAYAAGFFAGMIRFGNVKKAIKVAAANAESVIQHRGAKVGLLSWKQALDRSRA